MADPAVLTLIGTLCGGVGIKVAEHFMTRNRSKFDDASRIRDELRIEITSQREEITRLEAERDKYRMAYFDLRSDFDRLQTDLTLALHGIREQVKEAEEKAETATPPNPPSK